MADRPYITRPFLPGVAVPVLKRITDRDFGQMCLVPGRIGMEWDPLGEHAEECEEVVEWVGVFPGHPGVELSLGADIDDAVYIAVRAVAEGKRPDFEGAEHLGALGSKIWAELKKLAPDQAPRFGWAKDVPFNVGEPVRAMFRDVRERFDEVWADMHRQAAAAVQEANMSYHGSGHGRERDPRSYDKLRLMRIALSDRAYFHCGSLGFNFGPGQPPHLEWFD